jgi:predicted AAA+ superfamily ATPase
MFRRLLNPLLTRSFFLFGPRSTGKSTLLRELLPEDQALWLDLLDPELERLLQKSPGKLTAILEQESQTRNRPWVVIDEIQKVPELLSVIHQQISLKKRFQFAMTGSSARKLKRGAANLLGGRASWFELSSLTHLELGKRFQTEDVLNWGSLPEIFELSDAERGAFLKSYCHLYLKEEVVAEQLVRKVQPFRNFIELVAIQNTQIVNYTKFAKDCGVDVTTVQTYFDILQDTLIGFELQPHHTSVRKRQRKNPKFYLFDTGVTRALAGILGSPLVPQTSTYGKYFEQFLITEIHRLIRCYDKDWRLSYLTSKDGAEVDLIIECGTTKFAIEIKSASQVDEKEVKAFERLAQDLEAPVRMLYLSQDVRSQRYGAVECLHWRSGIEQIFGLPAIVPPLPPLN